MYCSAAAKSTTSFTWPPSPWWTRREPASRMLRWRGWRRSGGARAPGGADPPAGAAAQARGGRHVIGTALGGMEAAANVAVTSLPIAAVALGFGAYHLSPLPRRYLHPRLSFALLWLGAFGVAGAVARLCWLVGAPAPGGLRVALFVSLIMFGSMTSGTLRRQWADRRIIGLLW